MRLATVLLAGAIWMGALYLFWRQKIIRFACLFFALFLSALTLLPGRPIDAIALRKAYIAELNQYEGTRYIWGGENKNGIDCSGLVRQGLIRANFKQGLLSFNPVLIRTGLDMWWHDAGADALRDEYRNYTKKGQKYDSINKLDHSTIQPGDMAVTADGEHILAYVGEKTWIEADPGYLKVMKVKIPEPENIWFNVPVYVLQWRQLETR